MLKIEKLQELLETTRCKGNTTHLLKSVQGTNVDLLVYNRATRDMFRADGYDNVVDANSCDTSRAFVLDNSIVHDAINEALELIARLRK